MTPLEIEILLHYHCTDNEFKNPDAPAVKEAHNKFVSAGILARREDGTHFRISKALDLYIQALCDIPVPIQVWIMPTKVLLK